MTGVDLSPGYDASIWVMLLRAGVSGHLRGQHFRCRLCYGLRYQSQSEPDYDRAIDQADRIRERLGDTMFTAVEADELPPKPPRMWWQTYRKLQARYAALQRRWKAGAVARFDLEF
jgi:hypothetical protein